MTMDGTRVYERVNEAIYEFTLKLLEAVGGEGDTSHFIHFLAVTFIFFC